MISCESLEELVNLLKSADKECDRINDSLNKLLGEDTRCMYYMPYDIVAKAICKILVAEGESDEGADWFVFEGIPQIEDGGTVIKEGDKTYNIKSVKDYYHYLKEVIYGNRNESKNQ